MLIRGAAIRHNSLGICETILIGHLQTDQRGFQVASIICHKSKVLKMVYRRVSCVAEFLSREELTETDAPPILIRDDLPDGVQPKNLTHGRGCSILGKSYALFCLWLTSKRNSR